MTTLVAVLLVAGQVFLADMQFNSATTCERYRSTIDVADINTTTVQQMDQGIVLETACITNV